MISHETQSREVAEQTHLLHGNETHVVVETYPAPLRCALVIINLLECYLLFRKHGIIRFA